MSALTVEWDVDAPANSHTEVTVHARPVLVANEGTEKHVHGNDVRPEELASDKSTHGTLLQPLPADVGVQADGAPLIHASQFQLLNDIAEGPRVPLGAMMRGMRAAADDKAVEPVKDEVKAEERAPVVAAPQKRSEPVTVIELPKAAFQAVQAMHQDAALSFSFQGADRGAVLGTGAQHGITLSRPTGTQLGASV